MRVSIICIGSISQLHFVSSIIVFNWRASQTIFSDSAFLRIITGLMKVFPVLRESVLTGAIISKCVKMSGRCCTRSCNRSEIRVALCFLNIAVAFRGSVSSTLIFATSNLHVA